ncbi:hypothetical protein E2C01_097548 [Portunus trituberculatus]|uniref:Uncharacterized protein n=1 Tax=Portunus trituberculatus TaxID=210409 RepID=A0A5B7K5Z9_PORTR|nr:hypothetical protein [Portunus trituberculatus]
MCDPQEHDVTSLPQDWLFVQRWMLVDGERKKRNPSHHVPPSRPSHAAVCRPPPIPRPCHDPLRRREGDPRRQEHGG